jgi:tRNA(Ser,Leu) C12 N-acetylase TAN1
MKGAMAELRSKIGPGETWRMTVERRTKSMPLNPSEVIPKIAALIDARVDLRHPGKTVLVQLFEHRVSLSILAPSDMLSVVKPHAAAPPAPAQEEPTSG